MYDFAYHRPKSLADAVSLLKGKPEGRVMSGGMTLIPTLKQRLAKPSDVVKINVYIVGYKEANLKELDAGLMECFGKERTFASTVVGVQALARDDLLLEVEAVAVIE